MTLKLDPSIIEARYDRMRTLAHHRRKLNISGKALAYHMRTNEANVRNIEARRIRYGDVMIERALRALRAAAAELRILLDQWGY